jgi:hypothetical protein
VIPQTTFNFLSCFTSAQQVSRCGKPGCSAFAFDNPEGQAFSDALEGAIVKGEDVMLQLSEPFRVVESVHRTNLSKHFYPRRIRDFKDRI